MKQLRMTLTALPILLAGCVPAEVHRQDQARISELLARIAELQNEVASVLATQRMLEIAVVVNGVLLAVCLAVLWLRTRRRQHGS
jgi:outer membrane murein-binding lipoprotein Lpp